MADSSRSIGADASPKPSLEDIRKQISSLLQMVDGYKEAQRAEQEATLAAQQAAAAASKYTQNPTDLGVSAMMSSLGTNASPRRGQPSQTRRSLSPEVMRDDMIPKPDPGDGVSDLSTDPDSVAGMKVLDLFKLIDTDKSGELDKEELEAAMGEYGLELILVENPILQAIISEMEDDDSRCVGVEEFRKITKVMAERQFARFFSSLDIHEVAAAKALHSPILAAAREFVNPLDAMCELDERHIRGFWTEVVEELTYSTKKALDSIRRLHQLWHSATGDGPNPDHVPDALDDGSNSGSAVDVKSVKAMDDARRSQLIHRVNSTLAGLKNIDHHTMLKAAEAEGKGKFVDMALGPLEAFFVGLDGMIGLPKAKMLETMLQEHNSPEAFKAHNQGMSIETSAVVEWERVLPDVNGPISIKDYYGNDMCDDFMTHKTTKAAGLTKPEVVALRLYTGPLYVKYNTKLRDLLKRFYELQEQDGMSQDEAMIKARQESGDRFVTTIHAIASALIKLAKVSPLPPGGKVYRGLSGMNVPDCFRRPDKYGCRGGVEFGFMSTSMSKEQAMVYMDADEGMPTLFEVRTGQVDRGARLNWVSQFPREEEVLLPPLCNLEVEGDARYEMTPMGMVMVWPLRLNVNLKGLTVEELQERRKTLHVAMFDNLISEIQLDFHVFDCADSYKEAVLNQCREVLHKHKERPSQEYNEDSTYKDALEEALNIKSLAPRKMAIICQRRAFDCDEKDFRRILHAPLADIGQDGKYYKLLSGFSDFPWEAIFERAASTRIVEIPPNMNAHQISLALECVCKNLESVEIIKYGTAVMRDLRHLKFGDSNTIELCNLGATFGTDGAKFAASLLAARSSINSLRLNGSTLGRPGGSLLAPAIQHAQSLTLLELSNTSAIFGPLGASELFLAMKATTNLSSLSLANNHLGLLGVSALADAIRSSSHGLVSLDLSNCSIGMKAEEVLCSALAGMRKLQAVKLVGNVVMHKGCNKLAKTLSGLHTLTSINGLRLAQGASSWYDVRLARLPVADVFLVETLVQLNTQLTSLNGLSPPATGGVWDVASQLDGWWANVKVVVPFLHTQLSNFGPGRLQVKLANRVVASANASELLAAMTEEGRVRAKKAAQEKYKTEQLTTAHMLGAARQGHAEGVMLLKGAGLETAAEEWRACLHFAAEEGQQEVAKAIMAVGGEELVRITDGESKTCLHMAASKGHTKFAAAVLAVGGGALAKMQDKDGWTCLHLAAYSGYLDFAEAVLAVGGTDLVKIQSKDGWTCLHLALQREHKELSELFILVGGEDLVKIQDKDGKTCLHYAAYRGRKDVVEAVMEGGATELVKIQDKDGKTCLHYAAYRGRKDVADAFLAVGGAELVKIQDKDGKTCLHLAFVIGGLGVNWNQYKDFAEAVVAVGGEDLVKIKDKEGKSCLEWAEEKGRTDLRDMIERVLARTAAARAGHAPLRRGNSGRGGLLGMGGPATFSGLPVGGEGGVGGGGSARSLGEAHYSMSGRSPQSHSPTRTPR